MTEFLSKIDPFEDVKQELYARLKAVHASMAVAVDEDDEFSQGIDCRLANEELWLLHLLDKIEKS
jgi:hypothetical protein